MVIIALRECDRRDARATLLLNVQYGNLGSETIFKVHVMCAMIKFIAHCSLVTLGRVAAKQRSGITTALRSAGACSVELAVNKLSLRYARDTLNDNSRYITFDVKVQREASSIVTLGDAASVFFRFMW